MVVFQGQGALDLTVFAPFLPGFWGIMVEICTKILDRLVDISGNVQIL
jgi:hypothetical protein